MAKEQGEIKMNVKKTILTLLIVAMFCMAMGTTAEAGIYTKKTVYEKNNGKMQIVTYNGYWEFSNRRTTLNTFSFNFPGTIVNIEINTADSSIYILESETDYENIF